LNKSILSIAALILFTGCAETTITQFSAPDGSIVKKVKCNKDSNKCLTEASISCNNSSYQVIDSESHAGGLAADYFAGPVTWYSMIYKCGPSDGKMPTFVFQGQEYKPTPVIKNTTTYSAPAPTYSSPFKSPTTTNCNKIGDNLNCTTW